MLVTRGSVFAVIAAIIIYLVVAEAFRIYPLYPTPGTGAVSARVNECMALWVLLWSAGGWATVYRRKTLGDQRALTAVMILPFATSVLVGLYVAQDACQEGAASRLASTPLPPAAGQRFLDLMPFVYVILNSLMGAIFSWCLYAQIRFWRRLTVRGVCPQCGYNLTGNVSGQCPECGSTIKPEPTAEDTI